jgi:hypothetical protein
MEVDCARFGDYQSFILKRQGLQVLEIKCFREIDLMELASHVIHEADQWKPDAIFVDQGGLGAGVVDRIRQLGNRVTGVDFGGRAGQDGKYANKRAEMWGNILDWLKSGGALPDDSELRDDLIGPQYMFDAKERIQLEKKADMKKRGLASPDAGDALAVSFFSTVRSRSDDFDIRRKLRSKQENKKHDPHARFRSSANTKTNRRRF